MQKIPAIFKRDLKLKCTPVTEEPNPECDWVFKGEGVAYRKLDGINVKIIGGKAFVRLKPDTKDYIEAEYEPLDYNNPQHKSLIRALNSEMADGIYEVIGEGIRGNMEHMTRGQYAIAIYPRPCEALRLFNEPRRTYRDLMGYFATHDIEGIVYHHEDGRMAKIKTRDFYHLTRP